MPRMRIDLDGVALADADRPEGGPVAVFRRRTTGGLVILVPESADHLIPWDAVEEAVVDLAAGEVRIALDAAYAARHNWLRGARRLRGAWTDRVVLEGSG